MKLTLTVTANEREGKISGQKYLAFKTAKKDGTKVPLKFRREVEGLPKKPGRYTMEIESSTMNMKAVDYGCGEEWWVSENPISIKEYVPEDTAKDQF